MTHTLLQIYSSAEWYGSIVRTSKYKRGFKVPFAIDFGDWIMAFTSLDGITWVGILVGPAHTAKY